MARSVRPPLQLKVRMFDILAGSLLSRDSHLPAFCTAVPEGSQFAGNVLRPSGTRTVYGPVTQYFNTVNKAHLTAADNREPADHAKPIKSYDAPA